VSGPECSSDTSRRGAPYPLLHWLRSNNIDPQTTPLGGDLEVDEAAGVIRVEQFYTPDGGPALLSRRGPTLTRMVTVALLTPPPAGLLDAYRHTAPKANYQELLHRLLRYLGGGFRTPPTVEQLTQALHALGADEERTTVG
jgi:hypothetical protein